MLTRGSTYTEVVKMVVETCCNCGITFGLPSDFNAKCLSNPNKWFYCPNGHSQHYSESTEARLKKDLAFKDQRLKEIEAQKDQALMAKFQMEGQLNSAHEKLRRVPKGDCPCCHKSFVNLRKHMQSKHPDVSPPRKRGRPRKS